MRISRLIPVFGLIALLWGCQSAPPSTDTLVQLAAVAVPSPQVPDPLTLKVGWEPTGLRWPLFRDLETKSVPKDSGGTEMRELPASDGPLGLDLGSGLFLDSAGNLSLVPSVLLGKTPAAYSFQRVAQSTVWGAPRSETVTVRSEAQTASLTVSTLFGPQTTKVPLGVPGETPTVALGKKVTLERPGRYSEIEDAMLNFLLFPTTYEEIPQGLTRSVFALIPEVTTWYCDGQILTSSNKTLKVARREDHIEVSYKGHSWWVYRSADRGAVVDAETGKVFRWSLTPEGGLTADGGLFLTPVR